MGKAIEVESLPLDANGEPILSDVTTKHSDSVQHITENGTTKERGNKIVVGNMDVKSIKIESANIGKTFDVYEDSILHISVGDAVNGQICPTSVILGEVVLSKGKNYQLVYNKSLPIDESWTTIDRVTRGGISGEMIPIYPVHIKNQAGLMNLILGHESISTSPFVKMRLEHPVEIQEKLDIEALVTREKSLLERKEKAAAEFKLMEKKLEDDKRKLEEKRNKTGRK